LLLDVDHFKAFNDRYGHPAGDLCLKHVADVLEKAVPESAGCVARWGGEEFIVAMPQATLAGAMAMAQALCDAVNASSLRHERSPTASCVTISVGVSVVVPSHSALTIDALIARADRALYSAKHEGRNRAHLDELSAAALA
jgi:diguanylate cyclase (GGDEF)-like protein